MIHLLIYVTLFIPLSDKPSTEIHGTVTAVPDGNTIEVTAAENETYRVVLLGVDCPEMTQAFGRDAQRLVEKSLLHEKVVLTIHGKDRLKNYIGLILLQDQRDIRFVLLSEGLAWTSEKNPDPLLESIRVEAAEKKIGLWKEATPTPPWIYRRQQSMQESKSR